MSQNVQRQQEPRSGRNTSLSQVQEMKHKNYEPIKFEFFQTDMEKLMFTLGEVEKMVGMDKNHYLMILVKNIKNDLQHKIEQHKQRGEWV